VVPRRAVPSRPCIPISFPSHLTVQFLDRNPTIPLNRLRVPVGALVTLESCSGGDRHRFSITLQVPPIVDHRVLQSPDKSRTSTDGTLEIARYRAPPLLKVEKPGCLQNSHPRERPSHPRISRLSQLLLHVYPERRSQLLKHSNTPQVGVHYAIYRRRGISFATANCWEWRTRGLKQVQVIDYHGRWFVGTRVNGEGRNCIRAQQ